ncbi:MAG TPA: vitamin K epoxide reductase family protein [Caulifigura sp.]|nr:vitamin K epoxide reductase family protein [Caulifigura sp.]
MDVEPSQSSAAPGAATGRLFLVRFLAIVAIVVASAMVVDQFTITAPFCGGDQGCGAVTSTAYGRPFGVPLSVLGLSAFIGYLGLSLLSGRTSRIVLGWASIVAGAVGLGLILVQRFVVKQFCPLCVIIDSSALLMALTDCVWPLAQATPAAGRRAPWIATAVTLVAAPFVWLQFQPDPVAPDYVREKWVAGKVNVIEVLDFDCIYCRDTHPVLKKVLAKDGVDVHFVRIPLALDTTGLSREAGRIYLAAEQNGQGEPTADRLMEGESLVEEQLNAAGESVQQPGDDRHGLAIDRANEAYRGAIYKGLPQLWINNILLMGASDEARIEAAIKKARIQLSSE